MNWGALIVGLVTLAALRAHPDSRLGKVILLLGIVFVTSNIAVWFLFRQNAGSLTEVLTLQATQGYVRAGALSAAYAFVLSGFTSIIWGSVAQSRAQPTVPLDVPTAASRRQGRE